MALFKLNSIDTFTAIRGVSSRSISDPVLATVQSLDEKSELEPWLQSILLDTNNTPHGPAEVVDILTHKLVVKGRDGLAAFILKGRSFPTVRPTHASHQIFRLERIPELNFAILAATGTILDEVKIQFVSTAKRLHTHYCIMDAHDLARLFIAYGFICPRDGEHLRGGRCRCGYSPTIRTSNILQQEATRELVISHSLNQSAGAIVLPTGAGKTRIAAQDADRVNCNRCIYIAHSHEILDSAEDEFLRKFPATEVKRFETPPTAETIRRINLITIQLLARNLAAFAGCQIDYMIIDEFHHAAATSYRRAVDSLHPKFLLGLTATPFRGDRQDVLSICNNNIIICYELRQGIEFGVLCPYHYYGCFDNINYTRITHNGVRYDIHDLERALIVPERDGAIVNKWKEKAQDKATLAFCCSHEHAKRVQHSFNDEGIPAEIYLSETSREDRGEILRRLQCGEIKILCVVDVFNEGVDLPYIECLLFLRPTESKRIFFQQLGRGLRHFVGKEHCVVIDFIGNFRNAYRTVENLGLEPYEYDEGVPAFSSARYAKEVLNLPAGCKVEFDERVISVFGDQTHNPAFATRHNIARILLYQYQRLKKHLGRPPSRLDIDRGCLLDSSFYAQVFGSWATFQQSVNERGI